MRIASYKEFCKLYNGYKVASSRTKDEHQLCFLHFFDFFFWVNTSFFYDENNISVHGFWIFRCFILFLYNLLKFGPQTIQSHGNDVMLVHPIRHEVQLPSLLIMNLKLDKFYKYFHQFNIILS